MVQLYDERPAALTARPDTALSLQLVTELEQLARLGTEWDALARGCGAAYPFMVSRWIEACLRHRKSDARPAVVTGVQDDTLQLVWPLAREGRIPGRRRLFFAAEGPSDYQSLLTRGEDSATLNIALDFLRDRLEWDVLDLYPVADEDAHRYARAWDARTDVLLKRERVGSAPYLELTDGWDNRVDQRLRHTVAQKCRRMTTRIGPVRARAASDRAAVDLLVEGSLTCTSGAGRPPRHPASSRARPRRPATGRSCARGSPAACSMRGDCSSTTG